MLRLDPPPGHGSSGAISSAQVSPESRQERAMAEPSRRRTMSEQRSEPLGWEGEVTVAPLKVPPGQAKLAHFAKI